ncbi:DUF29 domain-containing protein [Beijerinckia sp. L45]|uniref:DUF29 domain-containing protein n=1 Tax=Beijerinckia sp. L45 TaxID=1641855 RepID=UPI00131EAAA9|nr:DUF29 domain-containing protein [Beijerinckia sp. L45]
MDGLKDTTLYETDFYSWTREQAEFLKSGQFDRLDLANLTEEIETLGRTERAALMASYRLICLHQLKRMFQPERPESRSWTQTIVRERKNAESNLEDNPGLKPQKQALSRGPTNTRGVKRRRKPAWLHPPFR